MNINIKCNVSISKKLRALIGNSIANISLVTDDVIDGRGNANLFIAVDNMNPSVEREINEMLNKETSLMFTPLDFSIGEKQEIQYENIPQGNGVTNIFSNHANEKNMPPAVKRLGAITAPEKTKDIGYAIKDKRQIDKEVPKVFEITQKPELKKYIMDINSLMDAVKSSVHKDYNVDIDKIQDPRKKAIAMEAKERAESIDESAFIVNDKYANLSLNDLGIQLKLNMPFNLTNVSSKRLADSKDLKAMLNSGMVKFVHPEELTKYIEKAGQEVESFGLEVFDRKGAKKALEQDGMMPEDESEDYSLSDLNRATEEEILIRNTIGASKSTRNNSVLIEGDNEENEITDPTETEGVRTSKHGNGNISKIQRSNSQNIVKQEASKKNPNIKTIRRTGIQFQ